jgi:hypothetical protein
MTSEHERLMEIKERAAREFMTRPNVTAVGIGGRERAGRPTGEIVIKVFVDRKRPLSDLAVDDVLPVQFEGIPVDVAQLPESRLDTEPDPEDGDEASDEPLGSPRMPDGRDDGDKYRPLLGGIQVQTELTGGGTGTLGCILVHQTDPAKVFALTNFHVVDGDDDPDPDVTKMGQPTNFSSSTRCCSHIVGTFVAGSRDTVRDAALIQLDPGTQWMAEIVGVGLVTGTHTITPAEAATLTYSVRKRGARTRLTGGIVEAINATHTTGGVTRNNVIVVRPKFNPAIPDEEITYFADHGDSGAVVVNDDNQIVGLHYGGSLDSDLGVRKGLALPIDVILGLFASEDGIPVSVAIEADEGVVHTVPGPTPLRVPEELSPGLATVPHGVRVLAPAGAHVLPGVSPAAPHLLAAVRARLTVTPAGKAVAALWLLHQDELVALVNSDRRVALVWHRCGGPALVQMLVRMVERHDLALPGTVNGQPLTTCLDRIHDAFAGKATPELRLALRAARDALPDLAGLTYPQIIAAFDAVPSVAVRGAV